MNVALACAQLEPSECVLDGWVHAFGVYWPRRNAVEHQNSPWSRAVILAKRKHEHIIGRFGEIIANHLSSLLLEGQGYVITPVPGEPDREEFLFRGFDRTATEILTDCIRDGLEGRAEVRAESLLVQVRSKAKRQHQCLNTAERIANVRGLYALKCGVMLAGNGVVLVDDVITSGATMAECARMLRAAGAREVLGVALARTVRLKDIDYEEANRS